MPKAAQSKGMNPQSAAVMAFIKDLSLPDVPSEVVRHARYLMLDLLRVAAPGRQTRNAYITCNYVAGSMAAGAGQPGRLFYLIEINVLIVSIFKVNCNFWIKNLLLFNTPIIEN